jgi:hypothetical protein
MIGAVVYLFLRIKSHYAEVAQELSLQGIPPSIKTQQIARVIIPISSIHRGVIEAITYANSIAKNVNAVYIEVEPGTGDSLRNKWQRWFPNITLDIVPSPYRSFIGPFLDYMDEMDRKHEGGQLSAVLIPEFIPAKWWHSFLHNQTAWSLKLALLYRRRKLGYQRIIIDVPIHLKH